MKTEIHATGYVLGHGVLNNPAGVRRDNTYSLVGLVGEDGEWVKIRPFTEDEQKVWPETGVRSDGIWLEELGPGRLVFVPDQEWGEEPASAGIDWGEPGDPLFEAREAGWGGEIQAVYKKGLRDGKR